MEVTGRVAGAGEDDLVLRALADPTRRRLPDQLLDGGRRTLSELTAESCRS